MDQCLLVLIASPSIEYALVDWLLERDDIPGFTSAPISGHGASAHSLTAAEQVAGRQRQIMFQMHLAEAQARIVIEDAERHFRGSGLHYWLTPVLAAGHMR
ncbi:MAG: DUF3240 family protein [Gammaproteobacteria bacterium]|jgi:hypothetical protein